MKYYTNSKHNKQSSQPLGPLLVDNEKPCTLQLLQEKINKATSIGNDNYFHYIY